MKKITILSMVLVLSVISVASAIPNGNKSFELDKNESGWIIIESMSTPILKVSTTSEKGKVSIKVFDSTGKQVAAGKNKLRFTKGEKNGYYKIEFTNKANKTQRVDVSWIDVISD